jgi:Tfp pilus assembly protein PilO
LVATILISVVRKDIGDAVKLRERVISDENELAVLGRIYDDAVNENSEVSKVLATLPSSYEGVSKYAKILESVAAASGVSIETRFADKQAKESLGIKSIAVTVKGMGNYENLIRFLDSVSVLPYHITVDSMNFTRVQGQTSLDLTFRLYTNIN